MAAPAKRIDGIDFWRGFALLTIFIDHVPENIFQHVTQKNFGFSDAAELFVFLFGVSVALAYGTRFFDGETVVAVRAVLRRAFTIYWVQILISLLIIAIFAGAAALWDESDLLEDADAVVSNPLQTTAAILALLHQLDNANILPLYIAPLLMTPLLLVLARRDDRLMLAASAGIYLAARAFSLNLSTCPVEGTWFFNPIAWQLIFAIGIFAGRRFKRGGIAYDTRLFAACLAVVAIAVVVRTDAFGYASGLWQDVHDMLDCGKTDLGFARLVHFLALAYIVYHSGLTGLMRRTRAFLPLCLIGRYSLPVFATGTVLSAMGEVIVETRSEAFSHEVALGAAIVAGGILMHYLVARGLAAWRDGQRTSSLRWAIKSVCRARGIGWRHFTVSHKLSLPKTLSIGLAADGESEHHRRMRVVLRPSRNTARQPAAVPHWHGGQGLRFLRAEFSSYTGDVFVAPHGSGVGRPGR